MQQILQPNHEQPTRNPHQLIPQLFLQCIQNRRLLPTNQLRPQHLPLAHAQQRQQPF